MPRQRMHPDQIEVTPALVRRLIQDQFPDWADLALVEVDSFGTDHAIFRLGQQFSVRLPIVAWATRQASIERSWLPRLAPHLPVAVPRPVATGLARLGYPFTWTVSEWLPGEPGSPGLNEEPAALDLARFIAALQAIDPTGAPARRIGGRGGPLIDADASVRDAIRALGNRIDGTAALRSWEQSLAAPSWAGRDLLIHTDLLPGNLLFSAGRLTGVIDWGGLTAGDPAADLQPAWQLLHAGNRELLRTGLGVDAAAWLRGRGWALEQSLVALPYYWDTNPGMVGQASRTLSEVLAASR